MFNQHYRRVLLLSYYIVSKPFLKVLFPRIYPSHSPITSQPVTGRVRFLIHEDDMHVIPAFGSVSHQWHIDFGPGWSPGYISADHSKSHLVDAFGPHWTRRNSNSQEGTLTQAFPILSALSKYYHHIRSNTTLSTIFSRETLF